MITGCPFCTLTVSEIEAMSDREADHLYVGSNAELWCLDHMGEALLVRRSMGLLGRDLIRGESSMATGREHL